MSRVVHCLLDKCHNIVHIRKCHNIVHTSRLGVRLRRIEVSMSSYHNHRRMACMIVESGTGVGP